MKLRLSALDLLLRASFVRTMSRKHGMGLWITVLVTVGLQTLAQFIPFLPWLSWPFLAYVACTLLRDSAIPASSVPALWIKNATALGTRPIALISLLLYGVLSFILYTGLSDLLRLLPLSEIGTRLNVPVIAVFPYAFAEAVVILFATSCASRLAVDDSDVFALLAIGVRDLLFSPVSSLSLILFYALIWTNVVTQLAIFVKLPLLSVVLGHSAYSVTAILWAAGGLRPNDCVDTTDPALKIV